jgi:hypothetical protein
LVTAFSAAHPKAHREKTMPRKEVERTNPLHAGLKTPHLHLRQRHPETRTPLAIPSSRRQEEPSEYRIFFPS